MAKDLDILKVILLEADEDTDNTDTTEETPKKEEPKEETPKEEKKPETAFEKDPMGFILKKYHGLNEILKDLMTDAFREYVTAIFIESPKPTTFKIVLHNNQYFYLTYEGDGEYEATIAGKKLFLSNIGNKEMAMRGITRLLKTGSPLKTKGPEGAEQGTRPEVEDDGTGNSPNSGLANGGGGGGGAAATTEEPEEETGEEEIKENKIEQSVLKSLLKEGGNSGAVRYNSEVGLMYGFMGGDAKNFSPKNPQKSIPSAKLKNAETVYKDIKNLLAPNYDASIFAQWTNLGKTYKPQIDAKAKELGSRISKYDWAGGSNNTEVGVVDVEFPGCKITGVSVKAEGGITLANLTPKALGLETDKGEDVFYKFASKEYNNMKTQIFKDVLQLAASKPNKTLAPMTDKYTITYNPKTKKYTCKGKKTIEADAETILGSVSKNAPWQRVFGDWFQANWDSKKQYAIPLYKKIAKQFEIKMEETLSHSDTLKNILRFADKPYFYATTKSLYYVPSKSEVENLALKGINYASPDGTSQKFSAVIGTAKGKGGAELDIYVRYANGMFESNPTVRIQSLKNPQFIGWQKI